jgi:beta-N-acetylhexosaminidase
VEDHPSKTDLLWVIRTETIATDHGNVETGYDTTIAYTPRGNSATRDRAAGFTVILPVILAAMLLMPLTACATGPEGVEETTPLVEDFISPDSPEQAPEVSRPQDRPSDPPGASDRAEEHTGTERPPVREHEASQESAPPPSTASSERVEAIPSEIESRSQTRDSPPPDTTLPALPKIGAKAEPAAEVEIREQPQAPNALPGVIDGIVGAMSLEEKVGQLFILALKVPGTSRLTVERDDIPTEVIRRIKPGGIILMGGNLRTIDQAVGLIEGVQTISRIPLFIAVDQEGGPVSRLNDSGMIPATRIPSSAVIGLAGDPALAYQVGRVIGRELRSLGINLNFAPVADVNTNQDNPAIGVRSYGSDPETVARMVSEVVAGMQDENVSAVLKHFPGHGDTQIDTHLDIAIVPHGLDRLRSIEFPPFKAGIDAEADGVMTAHIIMPRIAEASTPATFSPYLLGEILRQEIGHKKLVITDALEMKAITLHWTSAEAAVAAFTAGADMLLKPVDADAAYDALLHAVYDGRISRQRIDESIRRILSVKYSRGLLGNGEAAEPPLDPYTVLGCPEHQAVVDRITDLAGLKEERRR